MPLQTSQPEIDLLNLYIETGQTLDWFSQEIAGPKPGKHLIYLSGEVGSGKSALLQALRQHCRKAQVPTALVTLADTHSPLDILAGWAIELSAQRVELTQFVRSLQQFKAIQAQARAARPAGQNPPATSSRAGAHVKAQAQVIGNWIYGNFKQPELDLLLTPTGVLSDCFLADLAGAARTQRLALMLGISPKMILWEEWIHEFARRLPENVVLVLAGPDPTGWSSLDSEWKQLAQTIELSPLPDRQARHLAQQYSQAIHSRQPDPALLETMIRFSGGLPLVLTSAIQIWAEDQLEDFSAVKPTPLENLALRMLRHSPVEWKPLIETCSVLRWINPAILRTVSGVATVDDFYAWLKNLPLAQQHPRGLSLPGSLREILGEALFSKNPHRKAQLHGQAAEFFERELSKTNGDESWQIELEWLFHQVCADEVSGVGAFQELAEELTRHQLVFYLRALLNEAAQYPLRRRNSQLWFRYYSARLDHLEGKRSWIEKRYAAIARNESAEPKLKAYAQADWGPFLRRNNQLAQSVKVLQSSLSTVPVDNKLAYAWIELAISYRRQGALDQSAATFQQAIDFYTQAGDQHGLAIALNMLKNHYFYQGNPQAALDTLARETEHITQIEPLPLFLKYQYLANWAFYWAFFGRYREIEQKILQAAGIANRLEIRQDGLYRDIGFLAGLQGMYPQAEDFLNLSFIISKQAKDSFSTAIGKYIRGVILLKQGCLDHAQAELEESLEHKRKMNDFGGIPEVAISLAALHEVRYKNPTAQDPAEQLARAEAYYRQVLDLAWNGRRYFECAALTGLARIQQIQPEKTGQLTMLEAAEQLARQYEYNDLLAQLHLTRGHLTWEQSDCNDLAQGLKHYQHALVYGLRFNRFLLDEILSGPPERTAFTPILPACLSQGQPGLDLLCRLRDWWKTGLNQVKASDRGVVSPLAEAIPLLEAEAIARQAEPGDGARQRSVSEQLEQAILAMKKA
ncbi:MAG: tetratricopeptide repeat protein [Anaerolineales bacterium]|nr:tetratricopeptide repeat protein [Anaerolineales bacterium]